MAEVVPEALLSSLSHRWASREGLNVCTRTIITSKTTIFRRYLLFLKKVTKYRRFY